MVVEAIIPAAGEGKRMNSALPKVLIKIGAKPVIIRTVLALAANKSIKRIIIAAGKNWIDSLKAEVKKYKINKRLDFVLGGKTRKESVENCLAVISPAADFVLVHDAVRPFVSQALLKHMLTEVKNTKALVCAVPVKSTVKRVSEKISSPFKREFFVDRTICRDNLWEIQTPQIFAKDLITRAYKKNTNLMATDDASLIERLGVKVKVIEGSYFNIKITVPEDLVFAKAILKEIDA